MNNEHGEREQKQTWLIYGWKGWIGTMFCEYLAQHHDTIKVVHAECRGEDYSGVCEELQAVDPDVVFACIGRTHGKNHNTIDYLEQPGRLVENVQDNLLAPLTLAQACTATGNFLVYLGTGCIFSSTLDDPRITETTSPNFFGSGYSIVKGATDALISRMPNVLNLRIRMPISNTNHPRNFITKITTYEKIVNIANSMSVLPSLFPFIVQLAQKDQRGAINFTNPGAISHNDILETYKAIVDPDFTYTNFTEEEQNQLLAAKRSNNILDTGLLESLCPEVPTIKEAVRTCLEQMASEKRKKPAKKENDDDVSQYLNSLYGSYPHFNPHGASFSSSSVWMPLIDDACPRFAPEDQNASTTNTVEIQFQEEEQEEQQATIRILDMKQSVCLTENEPINLQSDDDDDDGDGHGEEEEEDEDSWTTDSGNELSWDFDAAVNDLIAVKKAATDDDLLHVTNTKTAEQARTQKETDPFCILITGGLGFIGSHFVQHMYQNVAECTIVNVDSMTYAAHEKNVPEHIAADNDRYIHYKVDITDFDALEAIHRRHKIQFVVHFAAESHVDKSFKNSIVFTQTNTLGTHVLLQINSKNPHLEKFIHISTDEVYGSTDNTVKETSAMNPSNPYAASKTSAEFMVMSYRNCFDLPVCIVRMNNVIGPRQYPEKLIPKFTLLAAQNLPMTVHGQGQSKRSFMYISDAVNAIFTILLRGETGEVYNVGVEQEMSVAEVAAKVQQTFVSNSWPEPQIRYVPDRKFQDHRYSIDSFKLRALNWTQEVKLDKAVEKTISWYLANPHYWSNESLNTALCDAV